LAYAGSPWRVAVQNASKVGVAGSGIRQVHVGRSASFDVTGCKTPANVTVLGETQRLYAISSSSSSSLSTNFMVTQVSHKTSAPL